MFNKVKICKMIAGLSSKDFKKNWQYNLYYIVTITIFASIMYSINAIYAKEYIIQKIPYYDIDNLILLAKIGSIGFFFLALGILAYIENYLFDHQKQKYYLLRTMGLSKELISYKIFMEQFLGAVIGEIAGIGIGSIFNYFLTGSMLKIMNVSQSYKFMFYGDAMIYTIIEIFLLTILLFLKNTRRFSSIELKKILKVEKKISLKKKPLISTSVIFSFLFLGIIGGLWGYYGYISHFQDVPENIKNIILIIVVVMLVFLIWNILSLCVNLKIVKRIKKNYKQVKEIVVLTELTAYARRLKYMLFSSTLILLFCILVPIMSDVFLKWSKSFGEYKDILDIEIRSVYNYVEKPENIGILDESSIISYLENQGIKVESLVKVNNYIADKEQFKNRRRGTFPPYIISLSDYNLARKMSGLETVELENDQFIVHKYKTEKKSYDDEKVELQNGRIVYNSSREFTDSVGGEFLFNADNPYVLVIEDKNLDGLLKVSETILINTENRIIYSKAQKLEDDLLDTLNDYNKSVYKVNDLGDPYYELFETNFQTISNNQYVIFTVLTKLLSLYLFIIGVILALSVLSLNYLFIMKFHINNEEIYRRIGVSNLENKFVRRKLTQYVYIIPLVCAFAFVVLIFGGYIFLNYAEVSTFVTISNVIIDLAKYLLVVIFMTFLYAEITVKLTKRERI